MNDLVGRGLALAGAGAAIGMGASLAGVRTLEGLLFGVSPFDAVSFDCVCFRKGAGQSIALLAALVCETIDTPVNTSYAGRMALQFPPVPALTSRLLDGAR